MGPTKTSLAPACKALVKLFDDATPDDVQVHDGPPAQTTDSYIMVGLNGAGGPSVLSEFVYTTGGTATEHFTVACQLSVESGNRDDFADLRDSALALFDSCLGALLEDPTLDDEVLTSKITSCQLEPGLGDEASMTIYFSVQCEGERTFR